MSRVLAAVVGCLCLIGASSVSCSGPAANTGPYRSIEFAVDSTRLGPELAGYPIQVRPPAGWAPGDSALLSQLQQLGEQDTSRFRFRVTGVFADGVSGSALFVKSFVETAEFLPWARDMVAQLRSARTGADLREEWLLFHDLPGVQVYSADSLRVQFAIVLDTKPPLGLDYVVPRAAWEQQVRSVESSLGTIQRR